MADSVVAGVLIEGSRILLCHRSPRRPGGIRTSGIFLGVTCELGETPTEALKRELLEELGVSAYSLSPEPLVRRSTVDVELRIWFVGSWNGTPANLAPEEHDAIAWFTAEELTALELAHPSYLDLFR